MTTSLPERIAAWVQPQAEVLYIGHAPSKDLIAILQARQCEIAVSADIDSAPPQRVFDVIVASTGLASVAGSDPSGSTLRRHLDPSGSVIMLAPLDPNGPEESIDDALNTIGLATAYSETVAYSQEGQPAYRVVLAVPFPARQITAFREVVHRLSRQWVLAEQRLRAATRIKDELDNGIATLRLSQESSSETIQAQLEHAARQQSTIDTLTRRLRQQVACAHDGDSLRLTPAPTAPASGESPIVTTLRAGLDASRSQDLDASALDAEVAEVRVALDDALQQIAVIRQSFSWRLTAPIRTVARWLGVLTTDSSLGFRK